MTFSRIAIVNRGEPAMRLINAAPSSAARDGTSPRSPSAPRPSARAMFVREADEAVVISSDERHRLPRPRGARTGDGRHRARDAAWVGWGFVAEHPEFADLCERIGVTFIGPPADVMRRLGDKIGAKRLAEQVGAPVAAWSGGPVDDLDDGASATRSASGSRSSSRRPPAAAAGASGSSTGWTAWPTPSSGPGPRRSGPSAIPPSSWSAGSPGARHIEVQVAADVAGTVWALGVRDCSIQRRNQKVIEESASPVLTPASSAEIAHRGDQTRRRRRLPQRRHGRVPLPAGGRHRAPSSR